MRINDGAAQLIEGRLHEFIAALIEVPSEIRAKREREARHREKLEAEARARADAERRAQLEARRGKLLDEELSNRRRATEIRAYVGAMRDAATSRGWEVTRGGDLDEFLGWASARADAIDPASRIGREIDERIEDDEQRLEELARAAGVTLVDDGRVEDG